jgi:hypothetical protein
MPTDRRRAAARRRAWGRGPIILRFERLEDRQMLSTTTTPLPDLVPVAFTTVHNLTWGSSFHAQGTVANQGTAAVSTAFLVNIYASPTAQLGAGSVLLGQATVPAGLLAGGQASYDQVVSLPTQPMSGVGASGTVYIETLLNPDGTVTESNTTNNSGAGVGTDTSVVTVSPGTPAVLTGTALSVSPTELQWGQSVQVSTQINNNSSGNAPATRARVVLTPAGATPGGNSDFTIGNLDVPAIPDGQSVTLSENITLPSYPPLPLIGSTGFTLSVVQDAGFQTNPVSPHTATGGIGYDQASLVIDAPTTTLNVARPNLSVTSVMAPSVTLDLGQTFQVNATLQNSGKLDAGPFLVRYLLVGSNGDSSSAIFLADATVSGLNVGTTQTLSENLQLPANLANYLASTSTTQGRIAVVIDPEHSVDIADPGQTTRDSGLVNFKLVAANGTTTVVPATATAAPTAAQTAAAKAAAAKAAAAKAAAAKLAARRAALATTTVTTTTAGTTTSSTVKKKYVPKKPVHTFSHNLKVFPNRVGHFLKDLVKGL